MGRIKTVVLWARAHPRIAVLVFAFVFFIVSMFFLSGGSTNNSTEQSATKTPVASPTLTPTIQALQVPTVYPKSGDVEVGGSLAGVSVFFNAPIDTSSIQIVAEPAINFRVGILADDPNRIILTPLTPWASGVKYSVKILRGVRTSDQKKELKQDITIEYHIKDIPTDNFIE